MKFFKSGRDLSKVAQHSDALNLMLIDIISNIERSDSNDYSEFYGEIFFLAYAMRRNVIDLIEENNWGVNIKIMVSTFEKRNILLTEIYSYLFESINFLAQDTDCSEEVKGILDKGDSYYQFEKNLPKEVLEKFK